MLVSVRMTVATLDHADKLLDHKESEDARKHPQTHAHVMRPVRMVVAMGMVVAMSVSVAMAVSVAVGMALSGSFVGVRHERVGDEVEEGIAQQATRGEAKEYLQQRLVARARVNRNEEQDEKRRHTDQ